MIAHLLPRMKVEDAKKGMENSLRANPLEIHAKYEK